METTIALGLYWGIYRDNGKENGNYYSIGVIGLYINPKHQTLGPSTPRLNL